MEPQQFFFYLLAAAAGACLGAIVAWLVKEKKHAEWRVRLEERERQLQGVEAARVELAAKLEAARAELAARDSAHAALEAKAREAAKNAAEQLALIERAREQLGATFKALAGDSLKSTNESFLALANKTFEGLMNQAQAGLDKRKEEITGAIKPLAETLKRYEEHVIEIEKERQKAYGAIDARLLNVTSASELLQKETVKLVSALRRPEVRGQWGEMTLRKIVEFAGMTERCDFDIQVTVQGGDEAERLRPDMVIHLPGGRQIVVDAKVPLDSFLNAHETDSEEVRDAAIALHVQQVRQHIQNLSGKKYWSYFEQTPEFVVMFLPESSYVAAIVEDRTLMEFGMEKKVLACTPTTLIALLWSVAHGWRQEELARNAQEISALGRELYDRLCTMLENFDGVRTGLTSAINAYNKAAGSMQARVFPAARKFRELGVAGSKELTEPEPVTETPRLLDLKDDVA